MTLIAYAHVLNITLLTKCWLLSYLVKVDYVESCKNFVKHAHNQCWTDIQKNPNTISDITFDIYHWIIKVMKSIHLISKFQFKYHKLWNPSKILFPCQDLAFLTIFSALDVPIKGFKFCLDTINNRTFFSDPICLECLGVWSLIGLSFSCNSIVIQFVIKEQLEDLTHMLCFWIPCYKLWNPSKILFPCQDLEFLTIFNALDAPLNY